MIATKLDDEPVIAYVDQLIRDAIVKSASDIHIEVYENHCRIRYRCDGLLEDITQLSLPFAERICTRLKILAHLDIAERRIPQDGRIKFSESKRIDVRLSTCPTLYGEKIVLRLLKQQENIAHLYQLGMNTSQYNLLTTTLAQPQGLIIVTGPTGSGKTNTLYAILQYLNQSEKNIISVEDPIEIALENVNQIPIHPKLGMTFATALRAALRQDPDIIMVGEIRDAETARMSLQAAQTGHLVLTTLHSNTAQETIARLKSIQHEQAELTQSIALIIAQRLVRKLCQHCKADGGNHVEARGCSLCRQGYHGRTGIFSLLSNTNFPLTNNSFWDNGKEKISQGLTTHSELKRVLGDEVI